MIFGCSWHQRDITSNPRIERDSVYPLPAPAKGGEMGVGVAADVVPVEAEGMEVGVLRLGESEAGVRRVAGVVDDQRLAFFHGARQALDGLVHFAGHRERPAQPLAFE